MVHLGCFTGCVSDIDYFIPITTNIANMTFYSENSISLMVNLKPDFKRDPDWWHETQKQKFVHTITLSFHMTPTAIVALPEPSRWSETGASLECERRCKKIKIFFGGGGGCLHLGTFLIGCSAFLARPLPCSGDSARGFINETLVAEPETYSTGLLVQLVRITRGWFIITSSETWEPCCRCRWGPVLRWALTQSFGFGGFFFLFLFFVFSTLER